MNIENKKLVVDQINEFYLEMRYNDWKDYELCYDITDQNHIDQINYKLRDLSFYDRYFNYFLIYDNENDYKYHKEYMKYIQDKQNVF
jgi:hypothetical protein